MCRKCGAIAARPQSQGRPKVSANAETLLKGNTVDIAAIIKIASGQPGGAGSVGQQIAAAEVVHNLGTIVPKSQPLAVLPKRSAEWPSGSDL
jgi:hypothetical protein